MDNVGCVQAPTPVVRKEKKKQGKDEIDRCKRAEKKKRRLEKALATSAAIRRELEKKKQKKIEEQQRLDEEGAAIAEAVALRVLCDDTDDSCRIMLDNNDRYEFVPPWDYAGNVGFIMGGWKGGGLCPCFGGLEWFSDAYGYGSNWGNGGVGWNIPPHYFQEKNPDLQLSAGVVAAEAVSSLNIAEDEHADAFSGERTATILINGILSESSLGDRINFCKDV